MTDAARYDLAPVDRWEAVRLDGVHVGFLRRVVADGVLTTRLAFQPTPAQREGRPELPERHFLQATAEFADDGATWQALTYEDSATGQRVRIERERAGLGADTVPSYADWLLLAAARREALPVRRLEEASPLQGGLRVLDAELRPRPVGDAAPVPGATSDVIAVEVVAEGLVLAVHELGPDGSLGTDWGGGVVSAPATADAALEGLPEDLVTFAGLPLA